MFEVILLGIALAMDALAMSIVNGIKYKNYTRMMMLITSLSFGVFQGILPLLGYLVFTPFIVYVEKFDHFLVLAILAYIGIDMIKEGILDKDEIKENSDTFTFKILFIQSIATAIDALSVGVTLETYTVNPYITCLIICLCTFVICIIGHMLGRKIALLLKNKALILGGVILIIIGLQAVLEGIGLI